MKVTVVIPVRNGEYHIRTTLEQLLSQTYEKSCLEILVVDGMSQDRTREVVKQLVTGAEHDEMAEQQLPAVRIIDNPKGQRTAALNIGIREATGDVIVRIDARTRVPVTYIASCVETLKRTGADNVGGAVKPLSGTPTQEAIGLAMSHPFGVGFARFRVGKRSGLVDSVYLGCFRKEIFDKVGLFDEEASILTEDSDMNYRIRKAGGKIYLNTDIVAYYQPRETLRDLWKLYFRYGGARAGFLLKHKSLTSWRQLIPPAFLLTLISLSLLSPISVWFQKALIALSGLYVLADLLVCGFLAVGNKRPTLCGRLAIAFPCMHFAWAAGFYARLLQRPKPGSYWPY